MAVAVITAIGSAIADGLVAIGVGFGIADTIAIIATAYIAYSAFQMLIPKPPKLGEDLNNRKSMIRSPVAARTTVYGRVRTSGPMVYAATTGDKNAFLHIVIPIANHEIDAVEELYFGDDKLTLDIDGRVTSAPYGVNSVDEKQISIDFTGIATTLSVDIATTISATPGVAILSIAWQELFGDSQLNNGLSYTVDSGALIINTEGVNASTPAATTPIYIRYSEPRNTGSYARVKTMSGLSDQDAQPDLLTDCVDKGWDADHRLRGIAYLYVRLEHNATAFAYGIPNVSCVLRGKKLYDPRTLTTVWSENPALAVRDYLLSADGLRCAADEIDEVSFIAAANICDELVSIPDGAGGFTATQKRYTCNGLVSSEKTPRHDHQRASIVVRRNLDIHTGAVPAARWRLD
jgi:hypothetical protein